MKDVSSNNLNTVNLEKKGSKKLLWGIIIIVIVALVGSAAYLQWNISKKNSEISVLTDEKTTLENEKQMITSSLNEITDTVNEVATKLQDIRKSQVTISDLIARTDTETSQKEQILSDITDIQSQLDRDKREINDLVVKMEQSNIRIKSLENMVSQLRKEINKNVQTLAEFRGIIESKNEIIKNTETTLKNTENTLTVVRNELVDTRQELETTKDTLEETRNTAYYIVGTKDELKERNILDENGWLIMKNLNLASDLNDAAFTKIDISNQKEMTISDKLKNIKVIPERNESSYILEAVGENQTVLKVTDPDKFWKIRYMAIVVKG